MPDIHSGCKPAGKYTENAIDIYAWDLKEGGIAIGSVCPDILLEQATSPGAADDF